MTNLWSFVRLSLASLLLILPVVAQTASTGALSGTITDANGAILKGAQVKITNDATGENRTVVSNDSGNYSIQLLLPGSYHIEFSAAGFKRAVKTSLQINVTETARLDIQLEVGNVQEAVTVTDDAQLLQTESSSLGRVADSTTVSNLPLVARNYTQIVTLSPGISAGVTNATELGRGTGGESGGNFRAHGAFGADNNFQMNGVQANDLQSSGFFSGGVAIPNPDAIQEFKVQTGQFDAAYGRNAGANVNVVTKGGSNNYHGSAFEFFRNDALNANDFFRNRTGQPRGVLRQNQFGFTIGGPLPYPHFGEGGPIFESGKDKLLFFFSYQGTRQVNGVAGGAVANISTPAFTNDRSRAALGALFAGQCGALQITPSGCVGPTIAANGSNISDQAFALLNLKLPNGQFVIPTPQTVNPALPFGIRGFSAFSVPGTFNEDQFMFNMDFLHTDKSRFTGRFFAADSDLVQPFPPSQLATPFPGFPYLRPNDFKNLTIGHVYTFSSSLLNQFDFGYNRTVVGNLQQEPFTFADIGVTAPPHANPSPAIGVNGSGATGGNGQTVTLNQDHYTFQDSLTWISGRHTFRFGGGITRSSVALQDFTFFGGLLALSWPDLLLGLSGAPAASGGNGTGVSNIFLTVDIAGDLDRDWKVWDGNAFIQDDIKVGSSLTLNLGLRYERLAHLADIGGRNASFDINLANPNPPSGGSLAGFLVSQDFPGTVPSGVTQLDNNYGIYGKGQNAFGPRLGFAWKLPFTDRMVLRGGYGVYYTRASGQAFLQLASGQPFAATRIIQGTNPAATFANPFLPAQALPGFTAYTPNTNLSIAIVDPNYRPPRTEEYSLNLQTDLGANFLLEVGYVGTKGSHLVVNHSLNQALLASPSNPIRGVTTNTSANARMRVPILGFSAIGLNDIDSIAKSQYDSLEVSVTKRLSKGLQFLAAYTFAHAFSNAATNTSSAGTGGIAGNQNVPEANYGRADFNREHRFVFSYVYDFPSPKNFGGFVNGLLGGWSLAGVTTIQSGTPLSLFGTNTSNAFGITTDRAQLAAGCTHADLPTSGSVHDRLGGNSGGTGYINRACILRNAGGTAIWVPVEPGGGTNFGNSGVGILVGPGQNNSDIALIKRTRLRFISESTNLEFRAEFFNAFNTPQFSNPNTNVSSPTFGIISSTSVNPRIIQFGLKLNF